MNVARELTALEPGFRTSPWPDHEYVRGWGVMMAAFSSGHLLGLRVFPQTDFGPYKSVWHRDPDGAWSIYNDGSSLDTTCPRLWGPALRHAELSPIDISWPGPRQLRVTMAEPALDWTLSVAAPPALRLLNSINAAMPLATWKSGALRRLREWIARRFLAMGDLRFSFMAPTDREAVLVADRFFLVTSSSATWQGRDLGEMVRLDENPRIGGVALPTRGSFIIGEAHSRIRDTEEYRRTVATARASAGQELES